MDNKKFFQLLIIGIGGWLIYKQVSAGTTPPPDGDTPPPPQFNLLPMPELRIGSSGGYVTSLQAMLYEIGYALTIDGVFGDQTKTAVMAFQTTLIGIVPPPGVVDDTTWNWLLKTRFVTMPTTRQGNTGTATVLAQSRLKTYGFYSSDIDGIFGPLTQNATIAFQRAANLNADGIIGAYTWDKLLGDVCP